MGIKWVTLVNRSTMTHIESYPAWVWGNPTIKSIVISSHFHSRIFSGCNNVLGLLGFLGSHMVDFAIGIALLPLRS
jgi:hypothetical protein